MKLKDLKGFGSDFDLDRIRLEKSVSEIYEEINAECNNFLRTQKGLQYLMLKYPKHSLEHAIREYYSQVWMAENYDGTEF